jgi:DNA-directed RNA polymerase specialized sigma24 family protein
MQAPAPPLLPLLRSRLQAELLMLVLLSPGREWSLTELAERAGGSVSSAQREMARAEEVIRQDPPRPQRLRVPQR